MGPRRRETGRRCCSGSSEECPSRAPWTCSSFLILFVQQRGERLVDEEAQRHIDHAFDKGERHIEDHQALKKAVGRGTDGLIHADDGFKRQVIAYNVGGVDHKVVERHRQHRHQQRAGESADKCILAGLFLLIDEARGEGKHAAHDEVEKLTDVRGRRAVQHGEQHVLEQRDDHAVDGAERERRQKLWKVRDIELDERGDERGDRELDEHQQKCDGREHGGHRQLVGTAVVSCAGGGDGVYIGFGHKNTLLFVISPERTSLPRCMTQKSVKIAW